MSAGKADQDWTVLELLDWTTGYFDRAGIENPRLHAELLLGEVLGLERIMLYARFDREVGPREREEFRELVKRRSERCPLQYLLGRTEFYGRSFKVTPDVLVPRSETELVVDKCLEKLPEEGRGYLCADVGTGSGVIAITLALERPTSRVLATDSSAGALSVAAENARRHDVAERVRFLEGRLTGPLSEELEGAGRKLDLLVSNPPYVPTDRIEELSPEVRDYEPRVALDGGPDGLEVIGELVSRGGGFLQPGGWLVLELGESQAGEVGGMVRSAGEFREDNIETETDGSGCERVFAAEKA